MHIYAVHVVHTCMHTTFMNVCDYIHVLQYHTVHTCFIKHFTKSNTDTLHIQIKFTAFQLTSLPGLIFTRSPTDMDLPRLSKRNF